MTAGQLIMWSYIGVEVKQKKASSIRVNWIQVIIVNAGGMSKLGGCWSKLVT